jgi:hypothetical protein
LPIKIEIVGTHVERKSWLPVPVLKGTTLPVAKGPVVLSSLLNLPLANEVYLPRRRYRASTNE